MASPSDLRISEIPSATPLPLKASLLSREGSPAVYRARGGRKAVQLAMSQVAKFPVPKKSKGKGSAGPAAGEAIIACNDRFLCYSRQSASGAAGSHSASSTAILQIKGRPGTPLARAQQKVITVAGAVECLEFAGRLRDFLCCTTVAGLLYVWKLGVVVDSDAAAAATANGGPPPSPLSPSPSFVTAMSIAYAVHPDGVNSGRVFRHVSFHPQNVLQLLVTDGWQAASVLIQDQEPHPDEEAGGIPELIDADGACAATLIVRDVYADANSNGSASDNQAPPLRLQAVGYAGGPHGSDIPLGVDAAGNVHRLVPTAPLNTARSLPSVPVAPASNVELDNDSIVRVFTSACAVAPTLLAISGGGIESAAEPNLRTWAIDTRGGSRGSGEAHVLHELQVVAKLKSAKSASSSAKSKKNAPPSASSSSSSSTSRSSSRGAATDSLSASSFELLPTTAQLPVAFLLERRSGALFAFDLQANTIAEYVTYCVFFFFFLAFPTVSGPCLILISPRTNFSVDFLWLLISKGVASV